MLCARTGPEEKVIHFICLAKKTLFQEPYISKQNHRSILDNGGGESLWLFIIYVCCSFSLEGKVFYINNTDSVEILMIQEPGIQIGNLIRVDV